VSYRTGEVSFWRPGAQDWAPAQLNTPLAPGDVLYTGQGANVEVQIGPGAFVRAADGAQLGLDNQEPDFIQLRVTAGHVALDLRQLAPGSTLELDTPGATFTVERTGYYHLAVGQDSVVFSTYRGGNATMTIVGGTATPVPTNQQVVVAGADSPSVTVGAAPELTAWDRWNYTRTDQLLRSASARYVPPAVYGAEALDQYGRWRTVESYGAVWVPTSVTAGWVPYSTGRWIWDPRFGWTWLDDAPWGWAPYHYGRWVFVDSYWAWAPGPIVVRPLYAPALVVFLGGVDVAVTRPVYWAPLGWGEPVIPWWGGPGFIGQPRWRGWGGPRVVNNVVINRNTTVNVTNVTVYRNVHVTNAVVGVTGGQFGRGHAQVVRVNAAEVRQLKPMHGPLDVRPVAASVMPATGPAIRPPAAIQARPVVATRPPKDLRPILREHGLVAGSETPAAVAPRLVPSTPKSAKTSLIEPKQGPGRAPGAPPSGAVQGPEVKPGPGKGPALGSPVLPGSSPGPGKVGGPPPSHRDAVGPEASIEPKKGPGPGAPPPPPGQGPGKVGGPPPAHRDGGAPEARVEPKKGPAPGAPPPPPGQGPGKAAAPSKQHEAGQPEGKAEPKKPEGVPPPPG
jgi:hypothetical protein